MNDQLSKSLAINETKRNEWQYLSDSMSSTEIFLKHCDSKKVRIITQIQKTQIIMSSQNNNNNNGNALKLPQIQPTTPTSTSTLIPDSQRDYSNPLVCEDLKKLHDQCFFKWYKTKFLAGKADAIECESEWSLYQNCLSKKLDYAGLSDLIPKPIADPKQKQNQH